jgi:tRNA 5-methylaminomethyl-2-thiouridine biosynthesis bifunctional protein
MICPDLLADLHASWHATTKPIFTLFDPDFGKGGHFRQFLFETPPRPAAFLRYLAVTAQASVELPTGETRKLIEGLNYLGLADRNAALYLWRGSLEQAMREFQGDFDKVASREISPDLQRRLAPPTCPAISRPRSVAVVGAGIAGSSVALALCRQGIQVHLYEAAEQPATGASGNWVGAFHPHITRGDSPLSRLSRIGFQHTLLALQALSQEGFLAESEDWATPGHLQTVPAQDTARTRETLQQLDFSQDLVRWVEPGELMPTHLGGIFFPQGGWVRPARWVQANIQACGELLQTHFGHRLDSLQGLSARHDAMVVCCAENSLGLAPLEGAQVSAVKGQISKLQSARQPAFVLSGESYAIGPAHENWLVVGATYERPVDRLEPTSQADEENLARFKLAFPEWPTGELLDHRCALRSVWHDRLPAIGPVPGLPGVFMSTGFASRGLLWAALGGHLVADYCLGQAPASRLLARIVPRAAKKTAST